MTSVTIVVDNFCQRQGLYAEWGFSAFIRTPSAGPVDTEAFSMFSPSQPGAWHST